MGQALYRKHRPKSLKEVIGQEHITETLGKALQQGRISHAYLFTGPKGVGKTSIARILAHEINGLPYTDDSLHLDIIEIDAASNRRIDEIRELRDKVHVAPTSAKYKVYIIDEVHMLTKEAFNALLKTLEEPPAHVVFILATTDAHKLPETIVSRTQRFTFKPVDISKVTGHLQQIAKREGLEVTQEALELLARHGEGSFRDSISLMDQAAAQGQTLKIETVWNLLGIPPGEAVESLLQAIATDTEVPALMSKLNGLYTKGYQASTIAKQLSGHIRHQLLQSQGSLPSRQALDLLSKLLEVPQSHAPEQYLEIILLDTLPLKNDLQPKISAEDITKTSPKQSTSATPLIARNEASKAEAKPKQPIPSAESTLIVGQGGLDEAAWPKVLLALRQKHNTLYGVVRMAEPSFPEAGKLHLTFAFAFHEKRIKEASNRQKLSDIIQELTGQPISVECFLDKAARPPKIALKTANAMPPTDITAISNIFGGAELLES